MQFYDFLRLLTLCGDIICIRNYLETILMVKCIMLYLICIMLYLICILVPYKGGVVYNSQSSAIFLEILDYDKRKTYQTFASTSVYLRFLVGSAFLIFSVFCVAIFVFVLSSVPNVVSVSDCFFFFSFFLFGREQGGSHLLIFFHRKQICLWIYVVHIVQNYSKLISSNSSRIFTTDGI